VSDGAYRKRIEILPAEMFRGRIGSTTELRLGVVSNFAWEFGFTAALLQNDNRYRKCDMKMNLSIQWAEHNNERFAVVQMTVLVLIVLEVLEPHCSTLVNSLASLVHRAKV
jgi:hypothetical protein